MPKEFTPEQKEFLKKTEAHRAEKVEELAFKALAVSLSNNIAVFDLPYYVLSRAKQIIEDAQKKTSFDNPKLRAARKKYLKECLDEMRKNIVVQEKKEEKDETDVRDNKCEPVAQEIVNMVLADDVIFSDDYYFDMVLKDEESIPLMSAIVGYMGSLDEKMMMITSEHWRRAVEKLFGREKEKVTFDNLKDIIGK